MWIKLINRACQAISFQTLLTIFLGEGIKLMFLTCPSTLMTGISKQPFQLYSQVVPKKWYKRIRIYFLSIIIEGSNPN